MVDKRGHDDGGGAEPESKKPRVDGQAAAAGAPAAPKVSAEMLEKLEKTKRLLQAQKELQEKLKKLPQVAKAPAAAPAAAAAGANGAPPASVAAATARAVEIASKLGLAPAIRPAPGAPPPPLAAAGAAAPGARPAAPAAGYRAQPLRLDAQGREVDEFGNVIQRKVAPVSTLKVNQRPPEQPPPPAPEDVKAEQEAEAALGFLDPRLVAASATRRRRGGLEFVEQGTFQKEAEIMRLRQQYGDAAVRRRAARARGPAGPGEDPNRMPLGSGAGAAAMAAAAAAGGGEGTDANLTPLGALVGEEEELHKSLPEGAPVPDVEWWDKPLLVGGRYPGGDGGGGAAVAGADNAEEAAEDAAAAAAGAAAGSIRANKITIYIEHPVPIQPPAEAPQPPPQPLRLTQRELKKLRTQRRQAREKEKQELVRQGLLEAPKPKVKISNLMRVLGAESAADPTAVEAEVRKQMAERQAAHDDRNVARMLTPAERREKKIRKMFDETGIEALTAVYRVEDLSNGQHRFKVDVNAKENQMSGAMIIAPEFSVVVVEGCAKSLKRYHKLMLRRIDWSQKAEPREADADAAGDGDEEEEEAAAAKPNACHLVWEGVVKESSFKEFARHDAPSAAAAREILERAGVAHYWDAAANFDPSAAPLPSALL